MNKKYLLSSVTAGIALLYANHGTAQCVTTQDCTALGYTESSCPNGGVKCPFGSKWFCGGDSTTICKQEGFTNACTGAGQCGLGEACANLYKQCDNSTTYKYTCSGEGYAGGSGSACNGKYTQCKCASGYKWNAASGACIPDIAVCEVGTLYYSDNTCSPDYTTAKTLLGVVVYSNPSGGGWVMTIKPIKKGIAWGGYGTDISSLPNYTYWSDASNDFDSCGNTDKIRAQGNSSTYPAAWAAYNYQPPGTPTGKRWCLPAAGVLYRANSDSDTIDIAIGKAGGTKLESGTDHIWSSTECDGNCAWLINRFHLLGLNGEDKSNNSSGYVVRPVLAF